MSAVRVLRAVWPLLFIVPLWAGLRRFCWSRSAHVMLHATMTVHEELPAILLAAAVVSVGIVIVKLVRVNASLQTLRALAGVIPADLQRAVRMQVAALDIPEPKITYLEVETPICYTVMPGPAILISRGFIRGLDQSELALVMRHELVHVQRRDPLRGLLWHLGFSALLVPGFGGLERWLYDRRERRTNIVAGTLHDARFERLARHVRHAEIGIERSLGNAYAGALHPQFKQRFVFVRPVVAVSVFSALIASHLYFLNALPMLERHHC